MKAMISESSFFTRGHLRPAAIVLPLLALLSGAVYLAAQPGDTPIVIGDGSLTMQSAVLWSSFTGQGHARTHPHATKSITSVDITMPALRHTVSFSGDQVEVDVTYASTFPITISTTNGGRRLVVDTDFGSFHAGADGNHLVHNNASGTITNVKVKRNGAVVFDSPASGHTTVTIHYQ